MQGVLETPFPYLITGKIKEELKSIGGNPCKRRNYKIDREVLPVL